MTERQANNLRIEAINALGGLPPPESPRTTRSGGPISPRADVDPPTQMRRNTDRAAPGSPLRFAHSASSPTTDGGNTNPGSPSMTAGNQPMSRSRTNRSDEVSEAITRVEGEASLLEGNPLPTALQDNLTSQAPQNNPRPTGAPDPHPQGNPPQQGQNGGPAPTPQQGQNGGPARGWQPPGSPSTQSNPRRQALQGNQPPPTPQQGQNGGPARGWQPPGSQSTQSNRRPQALQGSPRPEVPQGNQLPTRQNNPPPQAPQGNHQGNPQGNPHPQAPQSNQPPQNWEFQNNFIMTCCMICRAEVRDEEACTLSCGEGTNEPLHTRCVILFYQESRSYLCPYRHQFSWLRYNYQEDGTYSELAWPPLEENVRELLLAYPERSDSQSIAGFSDVSMRDPTPSVQTRQEEIYNGGPVPRGFVADADRTNPGICILKEVRGVVAGNVQHRLLLESSSKNPANPEMSVWELENAIHFPEAMADFLADNNNQYIEPGTRGALRGTLMSDYNILAVANLRQLTSTPRNHTVTIIQLQLKDDPGNLAWYYQSVLVQLWGAPSVRPRVNEHRQLTRQDIPIAPEPNARRSSTQPSGRQSTRQSSYEDTRVADLERQLQQKTAQFEHAMRLLRQLNPQTERVASLEEQLRQKTEELDNAMRSLRESEERDLRQQREQS